MKGTRRKTGGSTRCGLTLRAWSGHIIIRSILNRVWLDDASFSLPLRRAAPAPIARPFGVPPRRPILHRFTLDLPGVARRGALLTPLHLQGWPAILRGSLNRQQFQPVNNSWRSNLTANKLDRISRDLVRAFKPLRSYRLPSPANRAETVLPLAHPRLV